MLDQFNNTCIFAYTCSNSSFCCSKYLHKKTLRNSFLNYRYFLLRFIDQFLLVCDVFEGSVCEVEFHVHSTTKIEVQVCYIEWNTIIITYYKTVLFWFFRKLTKSTLILVPLFGIPYTISLVLSLYASKSQVVDMIWLFFDQTFTSFQVKLTKKNI